MTDIKEKADNFLAWEREKFIRFAQYGLIILIIGLIITRIIAVIFTFGYHYDYSRVLEDLFRLIQLIGIIVFFIGVLLFLLSLFSIAMYDKDLHIYLRVALIIALGLIISIPLYSPP